ncbi:hypothetical protein BGZ49_002669, partial [Haplosporangium sp. Z 27]
TPILKLVASTGVCSVLVPPAVYSARIRSQLLKKSGKAKSKDTDQSYDADLTPAADWVLLKTFILALSALIVTTLSALNFSMAVTLGAIIVFPYMAFRPSSYPIISGVQAFVLMAISPPGLLAIGAWWYSKDIGLVLNWVLEGYEVLGSWLLPMLCCIYWPLNLAATVMVLLPVS